MRISTVSFSHWRARETGKGMTAANISVLFAAALAVAIVTACGSVVVQKDQRRIMIADDVYLVLPEAGELTGSFNATQSIHAEYEDHSYSFEAHIEARPGQLRIVALNALGGALFSISFDGLELEASGSVEMQVINAEYVLADVLLAHWDSAWLNQHLEGASIDASQDGDGRFVSRNGELIIGISYESVDPWGGKAQLTHIERGYVLHIRTAEFTSL